VKSHRKYRVLLASAALAVLVTGCSGINMSRSVSPASFFLPGLMKADPKVVPADPTLPAVPSEKAVKS
jgi:hypothetical protein